METKDISLIYVFGTKRQYTNYLNGERVEWLKIGKHTTEMDVDFWDEASSYLKGRAHTGIPEICRLYEVYAYPKMNGDYDDKFRAILTDDMFHLDCSIANNKLIADPYEIKAGDEFVYNVNRSEVHNARKSFEHSLLLKASSAGLDMSLLLELILSNQSDPLDIDEINEKIKPEAAGTYREPNPLMKKLYDSLPENIQKETTLNKGERYRYVIIKSNRSGFWYLAGYSTRSREISVAIETYSGDKGRNEIDTLIAGNDQMSAIPGLSEIQGVKRKDKWAWRLTNTLDQTEDDIIQWYIDTIIKFRSVFEEKEL